MKTTDTPRAGKIGSIEQAITRRALSTFDAQKQLPINICQDVGDEDARALESKLAVADRRVGNDVSAELKPAPAPPLCAVHVPRLRPPTLGCNTFRTGS